MATLVQAVRMALHYGEEHLGVTDIFGEDVGPPLGGVFTATQGLKTAWNSPLDERGIIGTAMGIAYAGGRPVAEIQFCDYGFNTIDVLKVAGNQRWAGAGQWDMPIVLMTPSGSGIRGSLYHSHSFESWASRLAGWKIVMPSNPLDAYGLMLSAIIDPNPVMVLLPKALLRVGEGGGDPCRPMGLPLEIVPQRNPFAVKPGEALAVRVLFQGKPLAEANLGWQHPGDGEMARGTVRTNALGEALVPVAAAGLMTIRLTHMTRPKTAEYEWESFWTTLTFRIDQALAMRPVRT